MQADLLASHNERIKLMAGFYNAIGLGMIAVGVLRPVAEGVLVAPRSILLWIAAGLAFHAFALYILGYMRKETAP